VLSNAELVAVWNACDGDDDYGHIVRLLILTGARRQEIGGMQWTEFDPVGNWTLPAARSKNKRQHVVALPPAALAIIVAVPRRADREHLFGDRSVCGFVRWAEGKRLADRRLGNSVKSWRLHDIRRTVATRLADIGIEPHIIEALLNHFSGHRNVLADGTVVGRIMNVHAAPEGSPWMWTLAFGHHEDSTPTYGYEPTREAAMAAFAKSWRRK
jgi:integrase